jgi:hypothetical protein
MSRRDTAAALALLLALAACGAPPAAVPVDTLDGEITVHGFADWTHAWAIFLDPGVPASGVYLDTLDALPRPPSTTAGPCTITPSPRCSACAPGEYCRADDQCAPLPAWSFRDDGPVTVSGGAGGIAVERLSFDASTGLYDSSPPAGPGRFFAGGERLTVAFDRAIAAPNSSLRAPAPLVLAAPPSPLAFPAGGFHVAWTAGAAELIELQLSASDGVRTTVVRCLSDDGGGFDVPAAAIAALPPPPRTIHLEVTRNAEELLPTRPGHAVRVHVGYTVTADGRE